MSTTTNLIRSMRGVSYFIVSPRIGKLPNWPYFMQLVPRTILVGWNAELPRKVIVGDVHEGYTQTWRMKYYEQKEEFNIQNWKSFSFYNLKRHRWRTVSADNEGDDEREKSLFLNM